MTQTELSKEVSQAARRLAEHLMRVHNIKLSHTHALDAVAHTLNAKNRHVLLALCKQPFPADGTAPATWSLRVGYQNSAAQPPQMMTEQQMLLIDGYTSQEMAWNTFMSQHLIEDLFPNASQAEGRRLADTLVQRVDDFLIGLTQDECASMLLDPRVCMTPLAIRLHILWCAVEVGLLPDLGMLSDRLVEDHDLLRALDRIGLSSY